MSRFLEKFFTLALLAILATTAGCGARDESRWPRLRMLVAEEARPFTRDLGASLDEYKMKMGVIVEVEYVPGAQILERLAQTPRPDLVAFCDPALSRTLSERGLVNARRWLLERKRDRIAVVTRPDTPLARLEDLARPDVRRIGIPDLKYSGIGMAAAGCLTQASLAERLNPKLAYYRDQAGVARAIESGEAQAGMVRESFVAREGAGRLKQALAIDPQEGAYPPYVALAVCEGAANPAAAHQAFGHFEAIFRPRETLMIDANPGQGNMISLDNMAS